MTAKRLPFLVLVCALLGSCGKGPRVISPPILSGRTVTLAVFGAEWCGNCHAELPELQNKLISRLGANGFAKVKLELWVPTGKIASLPPSQENADGYLNTLGLKGTAHIDGDPNKKPPRWPKFAGEFPGVQKALPAGVLYFEDGSVAKKFAPGAASFNPDDIVATVADLVQNPQ